MRRISPRLGWSCFAVLMFSVACAGGIDDPERFLSTDCPEGFDVEAQIFVTTCGVGGCHSASDPQAGLDLASPAPGSRLSAAQATSSCAGEPLLDAAAPDQSVLYRKISGMECGTRMPSVGAALSPSEIECVRLWIAQSSTTS